MLYEVITCHLLQARRHLPWRRRTEVVYMRTSLQCLVQLAAGRFQFNHVTQRRQSILGGTQLHPAEMTAITDMNIGNGGGLGGQAGPQAQAGQRFLA